MRYILVLLATFLLLTAGMGGHPAKKLWLETWRIEHLQSKMYSRTALYLSGYLPDMLISQV
jgi:hypothetical protein